MSFIFRFPGLLAGVPDVAPPVAFQAQGVTTAGGTARWTRGADLTGSADGQVFFFSLWLKVFTDVAGQIYATGANEISIQYSATSDRIFVFAESNVSPFGTVVNFSPPASSLTLNTWDHWCGSFDLSTAGRRWIRKNGVSQTISQTTFTVGETVNFTNTNHCLGAQPNGTSPLDCALAEVWIDHQWVTDVDANIVGKFISGTGGSAVDLGATGTTPGLGTPIMYFSRRNGVSDFATNKGDGGGFTATGTPADGGVLPSGGGGGGGGSPLAWDDTVITSRAPKLYLPMEVASGNPVDNSASGLVATMNGTPTAYQVATEKGFGINLGGAADIVVNHSTVFETDHGIARNSAAMTWVYSEVCLSGQFKANSLAADQYLFGKGGDTASWEHSVHVYATTTGRLRVDARTSWCHVRLESPSSAITAGVEFHVNVFLGREGLWATLDGRMLNNGEKDPRHWYGWDHRVRGLRNNAATTGSANGGFNAGAIRIGKSLTGARANIVVTKFAVFVTGTFANRFDITDAQALAGESGAALGHPLFDLNAPVNVSPGGNIQTQIDAQNAAGGGTVNLLAGTHTRATNLTLRSNVRLKGAGIANTTLNLTSGASIGTGGDTVVPTLTSYAFPGALAAGATSITATNTLTDDAVLIVVSATPVMRLWIPTGTLPTQGDEVNRSEFIPVHTRTGTVFSLEGGLFFAYPTGDQTAIRGFNPLLKDCEVTDMTIDGNLTSGTNFSVAHFEGARRVFLRRLTIMDDTAYGGTAAGPTPGNKLFNGLTMLGCVDCVIEDVEVNLTSTFGTYAQATASHPYASQYLGGKNIVVMRGYVHSNDWTSLDIGGDNFDNEWTGANGTWFVPTLRMEAVDVQATVRWFHPAYGGHTSVACRWIGCETMNGGGFGPDGWQHEHFNCLSNFPTVPGFPAPASSSKPAGGHFAMSDRGECYACRVTLEGSPGRWFEGQDRSSVYVLVTKPNTNPPGQGPGTQVSCQYVSCTAPLPA